MFLTIYSRYADASNKVSASGFTVAPVWSGEVEIPAGEDTLLERIFRFFNRVDKIDDDRLDSIDYRLPSLTAGDMVMFDGRVFFCDSSGWSEIGRPPFGWTKARDYQRGDLF